MKKMLENGDILVYWAIVCVVSFVVFAGTLTAAHADEVRDVCGVTHNMSFNVDTNSFDHNFDRHCSTITIKDGGVNLSGAKTVSLSSGLSPNGNDLAVCAILGLECD